MRAHLRPPFLGTVSLLTASCATSNPPVPVPDPSASPDASASPSGTPVQKAGGLRKRKVTNKEPSRGKWADDSGPAFAGARQNASDAKGRPIYAFGDTCSVEVNPPRRQPPPMMPTGASYQEFDDVDCPEEYDDAAWDECRWTLTRAGATCYCLPNGGNPPPPPSIVTCPKNVRK